MARRVLADFDTEVKQRLGNRTDITATQRGFFVQDGYFFVCKAYEHPELQYETGITSAPELVAPGVDRLVPSATDIWWPTQVKNVTSGFIMNPEDMDVIDNYSKVTGPFQRYYWYRRVFVFDTTGDASANTTVAIKYRRKPPEFTSSPLIDQLYDPLIILAAARIACETVRDFEAAAALDNMYRRYETERGIEPTKKEDLNDYRTGIRVRTRR